jgi:hypothetical protein
MNQPATADTSPSFAERLGWRAERRPEPGFAHTLGAGAAALAVFAVFALVIEVTSDDATAPGVGFYLVLGAAAFLLGARMSGPVRSAAVTAIVFSGPLIWIFAFVGDGEGSSGSLRGIYLLTIATYAILYFLSWTKGRAIFLGLALLVLWAWVTAEVQGLDNAQVPFQSSIEQSSGTTFNSNDDFSTFEDDDKTTETSIASLVVGLAYLGAALSLDKKKLAGAATPFIVVGSIATLAGAIAWGGNESLLAGSLAAIASGSAVGYVGGQGPDRRFSTWFGVLFVVFGFIGLAVKIVSGDDGEGGSAIAYAGVFAAFAVALAAGAWYAAPRLKEHVDGDVNAPKTGEGAATA